MTKAAEQKSQHIELTAVTAMTPSVNRNGDFKYYIHDTAEGYRLQLLGNLTDHQVSELNCCWLTARNTLKDRKLILDLRGLKDMDERGKQWLAGMGLEGAVYIPESFLRDALAGDINRGRKGSANLIDRLVNVLRGCPGGGMSKDEPQTSTVNADSVRVTGL